IQGGNLLNSSRSGPRRSGVTSRRRLSMFKRFKPLVIHGSGFSDPRISTSLSIVAALCLILPAYSQDTKLSLSGPKGTHSPDRAWAFVRREAKARIAERGRESTRIKKLPSQPVGGLAFTSVILLEPPRTLQDAEADVIAPPRPRFVVAEQTFDRYFFGNTGG